MKTRDREWIKKRVSVRVDEFAVASSTVGGSTALEDPIATIDDELDMSAIFVIRNAREDFLYPIIVSDKKMYHGDYVNDVDTRLIYDAVDLSVQVVCPQDYLRFISLKLDSWTREVREQISPMSPEYRMQKGNKHTGGSVYKPVASYGPFDDYILKVTGTITGTFVVGETVNGSGAVSGADAFTAKVKEVAAGYLILNTVSGSIDITGRGHDVLTGATSSATLATPTAVQDEFNRYKVIKRYSGNQTITSFYNGQAVGGLTLATGDIIVLPEQTDSEATGTYRIGANYAALVKLTSDVNTPQSRAMIELFRAQSTNDEIESFLYVPRLKPEEMPEELLDAVIDVCASRVLKYLRQYDAANMALQSAGQLMGAQLQGFKPE
jgi:hypothetical protein